MEDHVLKHVRKFCDKLLRSEMFENGISVAYDSEISKRAWSPAKDMSRWASYLTFDIMGDLCFSNTFNMLDSSKNHYMLDVLPAGVQGLNIVSRPRKILNRTKMLIFLFPDGAYARPCKPSLG